MVLHDTSLKPFHFLMQLNCTEARRCTPVETLFNHTVFADLCPAQPITATSAPSTTTGRTHRGRSRSKRRRRHRSRRTRDKHHRSPAASTTKASSARRRRRRSPSTSYTTSSDGRSRSRSHAPITLRPNQQSTHHSQITNMSQADFPNIPALRRPHRPWKLPPPHFWSLS